MKVAGLSKKLDMNVLVGSAAHQVEKDPYIWKHCFLRTTFEEVSKWLILSIT